MLTMQYRIALPADYDMAIIRKRIADRGHLTDELPHLAFKAYLYADHQAPYAAGRENRYAPFYLWHDTQGMNDFLSGAGFAGVIASFGRPIVRTWSAWLTETVPDLSISTHASCETVSIPDYNALDAVRDAEHANAHADFERGAIAAIGAFNPTDWTAIRFRLWRDIPDHFSENVEIYQVGHISQPKH